MRKLILISSAPVDKPLLQTLAANGWSVYAAQDEAQARGWLREQRIRVGLALIPPAEQELPPWIGAIVTAYRIGWIMALPRSLLQAPATLTLISERCYDYQVLPLDAQRLLFAIGHAYGMVELVERREQQQYQQEGRYGMIGNSPAMQALYRGIEKAAAGDIPVLITGENGAGKAMTAQAIHAYSSRSQGPFVVANCAALPPLIQSELFGHEKGAFSGANKRTLGRIETAAGGTLLLDKVGDLALDVQANLLRLLEEKVIERVGGRAAIPVDARIIATTHTDLEQAVREGRFRADLYYRLNVLRLRVPSLREREGDAEQLARFFFDRLADETQTAAKGLSREALNLFNQYSWPGNVRELLNRLRKAMLLSKGPYITPTELCLERRSPRRGLMTLEEFRISAEREAVRASLSRTRYNISRAARELGVSRLTLYRLMEKHGIGRGMAGIQADNNRLQ